MLPLLMFVSRYKKSESSLRTYRGAICRFIEIIYDIPFTGERSEEQIKHLDKLSLQYLAEERDHFYDLMKFSDALSEYAPSTSASHFSRVKYWLEINDIVLKKSKLDYIKHGMDKPKTITKFYPLSMDDIKAWHEHLTPIGRVILQVQMSSGMRIGEILALLPEDINLSVNPVEVSVTKTRMDSGAIKPEPKNSKDRLTFISSEAARVLREWYKIRGDWLKEACAKCTFYPKQMDDDRIFPISSGTIGSIYIKGLKKTGLYHLDPNSKRSNIASHSLRKFFSTQLKLAGMPEIMVEGLAGHTGYLKGVYDLYPLDQMREAYQKFEYSVSLSNPVNLKEMQDTKDKLNAMSSACVHLQQELDEKPTKEEIDAKIKDSIMDILGADENFAAIGKILQLNKPNTAIRKKKS